MSKEQEIERKYLLHAVPEINYDAIIRITQHYRQERPERIRMSELFTNPRKPLESFWMADNPKVHYEHTLKVPVTGKEGLEETNKDLVEADFNKMKSEFPNTVKKLRHVKSCKLNKGMKWEIDDFSLHRTEMVAIIMVEIEVPSMGYKVKFPEWLKPYILKEVTGDPLYGNCSLAKRNMYK